MQIKKKSKGRGLGKMISARLLSTRAIASVMIGLIMIVTVSLFFIFPPLSVPTTVTSLTQNEAATSLKANEAPGYASSGSDAAVKNAVVHIGPHKTGSTTIQEHSLALQTHLLSDGYGMPYAHTFTDGKKFMNLGATKLMSLRASSIMPTILKRDIFHAATTCYKPDWT
jgi:hypothetical protein